MASPGYVSMLFPVDGEPTYFQPGIADERLERLQAAVGGYIETFPSCVKGWVFVVNEEGRMKGMEDNTTVPSVLLDKRFGVPCGPCVHIKAKLL